MPAKSIAVLLFLVQAGYAQASLSFEVASVRANPAGKAGGEKGARESIDVSPGGLAMRNVTLRDSVRWAYGVKDFQIAAPGWLASERYDIIAKAPGPASNGELRLMLQSLLAERFKLALHRAARESRVFVLLVGKNGPKLREASEDGLCAPRPAGRGVRFQGCSVSNFADFLSHLPALDLPVLDQTGLPGFYDFTVQFAELQGGDMMEMKRAAEEAFRDPALGSKLAEQLGLRLEARKQPADFIVIDHAEKIPVEN